MRFLENESTAALVASDWVSLDRLARKDVQSCGSSDGPQRLAQAYERLSFANNKFGRASEALKAADQCITTQYSRSGCHIEKAQALVLQGRVQEAWTVLDVADRLAGHAYEIAKRDLASAQTDSDEELQSSKLALHESELAQIARIRKDLLARH